MRVWRIFRRQGFLVNGALITMLAFFVWRPIRVFPDPSFFHPRASKQITLNHTYRYDGRNTCGQKKHASGYTKRGPDVIILILSAVDHFDHRDAIRDTYGSLSRGQHWPGGNKEEERPIENLYQYKSDEASTDRSDDEGSQISSGQQQEFSGSVRILFLLAESRSSVRSEADVLRLAQENDKFGDLVQFAGLEEDYINLTYKVLLGFRWVKDFCSSSRFVVKVDDDTFIHIPRLFQYLQRNYGTVSRQEKSEHEAMTSSQTLSESFRKKSEEQLAASSHLSKFNNIHGHLCPRSFVKRWGKYSVSFQAYPFLIYPPYATGALYFMPTDVALRILSIAEYFPYNNMEDVHVTGTLALAAGVRHLGFTEQQFDESVLDLPQCAFANGALAKQDLSAVMFKLIWKTFSLPSDYCVQK